MVIIGVKSCPNCDDEDLDGAGQDVVIAERGSEQEKADGGSHERKNEALFFLIEAGSDEEPDLVENERARKDSAGEQRDIQIQVQRIHGMREDE